MATRLTVALAALSLTVPLSPAFAQVEYDTSQLSQHSDIVRQRVLIDQTVRRNHTGATVRGGPTSRTAQTCANARRMGGTGAQGQKLAKLRSLCRQRGL